MTDTRHSRSLRSTVKKPDFAHSSGRSVPSQEVESATRILFIEDDKVYFNLLKVVIESVKNVVFEIVWATNLHDGLEIVKNQRVDIILLDLMLPDSEGLESFKRVYEHAGGTPIIVLSGTTDEQQAMEAVYLGAQDFLIKSQVGIDSLVRCIRYTLARLQVAEYRERLQAITDFTAALAHDLRGPLIGAERTLSGMLSRTDMKLPPDEVALLQVLQANNNFLRQKVDALLEIYRFESEIHNFEVAATDMSEILKTCIADLFELAHTREHKVVVKAQSALIVLGNAQALTQLCTNLLENAIKFSPPGSPIEVKASVVGNKIKIVFKDFGQGIAPDDAQILFKNFWRGGSHTFVPGSGLGLYLCEKIVRAHGGMISCQSTLGVGSSFVVTLPAKDSEAHHTHTVHPKER